MDYKELQLIKKDNLKRVYAKLDSRPKPQNGEMYVVKKYLGIIDPLNIKDYIAIDGFMALYKVLNEYTPLQVIDQIEQSGLRGRGGAGFSTGTKWRYANTSVSDEKYIICNGDEGDPGAFMDRCIVEGNPFSIIEAMAIAGYAIGANNGIVYIRAEYPLASQTITKAIDIARNYGLLGNNIFGSNFCFDIAVKYGAGAFVCGEETSLIKSCEGKRGEPRVKPPYPATSGYLGKPTVINNVETLTNIPAIILNGAQWFSSIGVPTSTGTKVFALSGKINKPGLIEMPLGVTINDCIFGAGDGVPNGKKLKAVQMGGPSGGCIPASLCQTKIDYDSLKQLGSMMGSGGMVVMDEDTCMVDIARFFINFSVDESCGKCTPCRIGNKRMSEILSNICNGLGTLEELDELEELAHYVKNTAICGLGQCSPNPVLSTLKYFKQEYIDHIVNKKCTAHVCNALCNYEILPNECKKCGMCARGCPKNAISLSKDNTHYEINAKKCVKCGKCYNTCPFKAIVRR